MQVSLSLEEKQRLAREQEQQRFLKVNKPLDAKSSGSTGSAAQNKPKQTASNKPKDLTSSLMQSNMMGLSSTANKPSANYSSLSSGSSGMSSGFSGGMSQPSTMSSMNSSFSSGMSSVSSGGFGMGMSQNGMSQKNKQVDMSSFDNLLSTNSQSPKMSMNQMSQNRGSPLQQGMMGNTQSTMGNAQSMMGQQQGMMGQQQGMMGNPGIMGNQGMMRPQQGMMGTTGMGNSGFGGQTMNSGFGGAQMNTGFGQMGLGNQGPMFQQNQGMLQPQPMANQNFSSSTQSSARNDLDDLFG